MYVFEDLNKSLEKTLFALTSKMIKIKNMYLTDVYKNIATYIIPERLTLFDNKQRGQTFGEEIYSGWPGYCHRKMTNSIYGNLCPRNTAWMRLSFPVDANPSRAMMEELNKANKQILGLLDRSNFYGNQTQFISDGIGFGNGVQYIKDDVVDKKTKFIGIHPAQYYLDADDDGDIKAILRKATMTYLDVLRIIRASTMGVSEGDEDKYIPDTFSNDEEYLEDVDVFHITMKYDYYKDFIELPDKYVGEFKYISVWYFSEHGKAGEVFAIDHLSYFPYVTWLYNLETGWQYGFGPGHYALNDAIVLQQHAKSRLVAGQRAAVPPLQAPEELKGKISNRAGGFTWYEDSTRLVQGLYQQNSFPISTEVTTEIKQIIGFHYMLDVWQTLSEITARMTAYEVSERIGEKMSMISAVVGNFLNQGLTQQVKLFVLIEKLSGRLKFSKALEQYMNETGVEIEYISLLAQSVKKHLENQGLIRTVNEMQMAFELNEDLRLAFNWWNFAKHLIDGSTASPDILKEERQFKAEVEAIKRQKQMEAQAKMQGGQGGAGQAMVQ